jgi:hypothetical protein
MNKLATATNNRAYFISLSATKKKVSLHFWQVTSGTIEEKIFQRQLTKQGLGGGILDPERSGGSHQFHFSTG